MASRRVRLGLLLCVIVLGPIAAAAVPPTPVRGPILIDGDASFTAENGVVRGTGAPDDPYVIEGWTIAAVSTPLVSLRNTSRHVVVDGMTLAAAACVTSGCQREAVALVDVANVTLRDLAIHGTREGVRARGAVDLDILGLRMGLLSATPVLRAVAMNVITNVDATTEKAIVLERSARVRIEDAEIRGASYAVDAANVSGLAIRASALEGALFSLVVGGASTDVSLDDLHVVRGTVNLGGDLAGARVLHSTFEDSFLVFPPRSDESTIARDVVVCGNTFRDRASVGLALHRVDGASVVGNTFERVEDGMSVHDAVDVDIRGNRFGAEAEFALTLVGATGVALSQNAFAADGGIVSASGGVEGSATGNWWGSADGPSGAGPGSGARLVLHADAHLPFAPWLTERPPSADCGT